MVGYEVNSEEVGGGGGRSDAGEEIGLQLLRPMGLPRGGVAGDYY